MANKPVCLLGNWFIEPLHDKTSKMTVCPAKTQISLGIHPVWSESSLCAQWVAKDPSFLHVDSEDSDQTGRMPRLIWDFVCAHAILLVLSCGSSFLLCSADQRQTRLENPLMSFYHQLERKETESRKRNLKNNFRCEIVDWLKFNKTVVTNAILINQ